MKQANDEKNREDFLKGKKKKSLTYNVPNLITRLPVSSGDLLFGGILSLYASELLGFGASFLPESAVTTAIQNGFMYASYYSSMLVNFTFAGMLFSGGIDLICKPPRDLHKQEIVEKLGCERKDVDRDTRMKKIDELCLMISDDYTEKKYSMKEEAKIAGKTLDEIIYKIEGVRIKTSNVVKNSYVTKYIMPHALGGCNLISGEIEIFRQLPYMSFSISAHELAHRKTYINENEAEVLAHLTGFATKNPVFIQSSRVSRLRREYQTLFQTHFQKPKEEELLDFFHDLKLPQKLKNWMVDTEVSKPGVVMRGVMKGQLAMYKVIMRILGQKEGLRRYTEIFTADLYAMEQKYGSVENLVEYLKQK